MYQATPKDDALCDAAHLETHRHENTNCSERIDASASSACASLPRGVSRRGVDAGYQDLDPTSSCLSIMGQSLGLAIGTVISAVIYQLFMLAVLAQSIWQGWPVDTNQWQEELSCNSWLAALAVFLVLLASPILLLTSPAAPAIIDSDAAAGADHAGNRTMGSQANHTLAQTGDSALEGDWVVALYAFVFCIFLVQLATIYYAYLRKDLGLVLQLDARFRYGRCPASLCPCNRGFWRRDGVTSRVSTRATGSIPQKCDDFTANSTGRGDIPAQESGQDAVALASRSAAEGVTSEEIDTQRGATAVAPHSASSSSSSSRLAKDAPPTPTGAGALPQVHEHPDDARVRTGSKIRQSEDAQPYQGSTSVMVLAHATSTSNASGTSTSQQPTATAHDHNYRGPFGHRSQHNDAGARPTEPLGDDGVAPLPSLHRNRILSSGSNDSGSVIPRLLSAVGFHGVRVKRDKRKPFAGAGVTSTMAHSSRHIGSNREADIQRQHLRQVPRHSILRGSVASCRTLPVTALQPKSGHAVLKVYRETTPKRMAGTQVLMTVESHRRMQSQDGSTRGRGHAHVSVPGASPVTDNVAQGNPGTEENGSPTGDVGLKIALESPAPSNQMRGNLSVVHGTPTPVASDSRIGTTHLPVPTHSQRIETGDIHEPATPIPGELHEEEEVGASDSEMGLGLEPGYHAQPQASLGGPHCNIMGASQDLILPQTTQNSLAASVYLQQDQDQVQQMCLAADLPDEQPFYALRPPLIIPSSRHSGTGQALTVASGHSSVLKAREPVEGPMAAPAPAPVPVSMRASTASHHSITNSTAGTEDGSSSGAQPASISNVVDMYRGHGRGTPPRWVELRYADGSTPCLVCPCSLALWRNWLMIGIAGLELLQLVSMGMNSSPELLMHLRGIIPAELAEFVADSADVLFKLGSELGGDGGSETSLPFRVCVSFCSVYVLLAGLFIALDLGLDSFVAPLLFSLFAGGLYVTVTSTLLFVIANTADRGEAIACAVCLVYYSSTAVFMSIYRGDASAVGAHAAAQVSTIPLFLAVERVLKGALASAYVLIANDMARSAAVTSIIGLYFLLFAVFRPTSVHALSAARLAGIGMGLWAATCALLAVAGTNLTGAYLAWMLVAGWGLACIAVWSWVGVSCGHCSTVCVVVRHAEVELDDFGTRRSRTDQTKDQQDAGGFNSTNSVHRSNSIKISAVVPVGSPGGNSSYICERESESKAHMV